MGLPLQVAGSCGIPNTRLLGEEVVAMTDSKPGQPPPLPARVVVAVFDREEDGADAVRELQELGWTSDRLGAVYRSESSVPPPLSAAHTLAEEKMVKGAAIGGAAGLALGAAAVFLPGVGPLAVLGALELGVLGVAKGGLLGSFIGSGIPEKDANDYVTAVREGGFFVEASADDGEQAAWVEQMFRAHDPRAVHTYDPARSAG
jgi:hypothetical protein